MLRAAIAAKNIQQAEKCPTTAPTAGQEWTVMAMAETMLSRERLLAAMEACDKGACADCPYTDEDDCTMKLMRLAEEHIYQMSEEIDNYRKEYLRQKLEAEYQICRADLLHAQLQRVFDMYVRAELRAQKQEGDSHADDD